jgi:hypothetical protein
MMSHLSRGYQVMGPDGGVDSETAQREHETGRGYKVPNGAIYTTVGDLARFASFLMDQGPESVLKTAALDRFQKQLAVPADIGLTSGYGIGFQVDRRDNYVAFGHGGAVAGYTSMLLINRAKGIGVIVFANGAANPTSLASDLWTFSRSELRFSCELKLPLPRCRRSFTRNPRNSEKSRCDCLGNADCRQPARYEQCGEAILGAGVICLKPFGPASRIEKPLDAALSTITSMITGWDAIAKCRRGSRSRNKRNHLRGRPGRNGILPSHSDVQFRRISSSR